MAIAAATRANLHYAQLRGGSGILNGRRNDIYKYPNGKID